MTDRTDETLPVIDCDLLVAGSGASGMTAAIVAAKNGLKVIVVEKESVFGGTTALSGGYLWVPNNFVSQEAGVKDSKEAALNYIRHEAGNQFDGDRAEAFLDAGPAMVTFMHEHTHVRFEASPAFSDYHPDAPGGTAGGRSILAQPVKASMLGRDLDKLRPPRKELTLFGLAIGSGKELWHFYRAFKSPASFIYVTQRLTKFGIDKALTGRSQLLTNGNALAARLFRSARDLGVEVLLDSPVKAITRDADGAVTGATILTPQGSRRVLARRGVVLACGGFPQDIARRKALYKHPSAEGEHVSTASPGNTGDGLRMAEAIGAATLMDYPNAGAWAPTSLVPRPDGTKGPFPHFIDRGKPGVIAVLRNGRRFVNEANSYHDFVQGLEAATPSGEPAEAFLICDHRTIRKYGLGHVKPAPLSLGPSIKSGYLIAGKTLDDLARNAGVDPVVFKATVTRFNSDVPTSVDTEFGRGSTAYNRFHGDPQVTPNPCMAPIKDGPFYAVRVIPGSIGTFAGIKTDRHARVLSEDGTVVSGLYAVGNDMASVLGGNYSGGGITLGPGMAFGFIAGQHASAAIK
ncbi:Succinate dehydrogenase/fumarate reductase, flavoprotein subunit [Pseudosulfitobacter pseudonitzschiae]|uniref:3-oxosteroid 1-dehydrogenase n=1 Tax=Pseudosulfitobacter pseudonitzschiae TaxID=1402135 RepID=A0A073IVU1_9RHOB|nr:FAD-dependent oxidoreductase [Pseudosulfitobacter pseudonitzschiae]KEJ93740.1 3-oxosteroid 1-dehydrogenase [Pseudosulfitobacter pseudonitzschiae]QKS07486.1 FAD-dependent oxidoreductase [Pseudosulfitobacter pseudonitzschiae]SHF15334.1 Succinate dehydrogenase/fumarate reductase, flavoprotein subunit [Pseudosulfitobacter pseudonitzschiae]